MVPRGCQIWYLSATSEKTQNSLLHLGVAKDWGLHSGNSCSNCNKSACLSAQYLFCNLWEDKQSANWEMLKKIEDKLLHLFQNWTQYSSFSSCKSNFFLRLFLSGCSRFLCNILNFRLFVFLASCKQIGHCVDYVLSKFCPSLYLRPKMVTNNLEKRNCM